MQIYVRMSWKEVDNKLTKTFEFSSYLNLKTWLEKAIALSEDMNHHFDAIHLPSSNKLRISMHTHSAGNIVTEKDHKLAAALDQI